MYTQTPKKRECGRGIWKFLSIYAVDGTKDAKNEGNVSVNRFYPTSIGPLLQYFHQLPFQTSPNQVCLPFQISKEPLRKNKNKLEKKKLSRCTGNTGKLQHLNPLTNQAKDKGRK